MIVSRQAAEALERQHDHELRRMTEREAVVAADRLLAIAATADYPPERKASVGLIARQRILHQICG